MKAAYYEGNKKFSVGESPIIPPGQGQVRMEVAYCGICGTDLHIFLGHMDHRLTPPQVVGHEASGTIVEVGEGVTDFKVGDHVVLRPTDACGNCPTCARRYQRLPDRELHRHHLGRWFPGFMDRSRSSASQAA